MVGVCPDETYHARHGTPEATPLRLDLWLGLVHDQEEARVGAAALLEHLPHEVLLRANGAGHQLVQIRVGAARNVPVRVGVKTRDERREPYDVVLE
jgi:hypothetical protein